MSIITNKIKYIMANDGARTILRNNLGDTVNCPQLLDYIAVIHHELRCHGFNCGDRFAIIMPDGIDLAIYLLAFLGAYQVLPLSTKYTAGEYQQVLDRFDIENIIILDNHPQSAAKISLPNGFRLLKFPSLNNLKTLPEQVTELESNNPNAVTLLLQTSGTTGTPKRIGLTEANILASVSNISSSLKITQADSCLCVMPLFHIHGIVATLLTPLISGGSVVVIEGGFNTVEVFKVLRNQEISWYSAVPTMHKSICDYAKTIKPSTKLRFVRSSSSPLPQSTREKLHATFHVPVLQAYGMTEAAHQISTQIIGAGELDNSVGFPNVDIRIKDENGQDLPHGEVGEVCIAGENVFKGYMESREINQKSFWGKWFRTGDVAFLTKDNELVLVSRIKEMINKGGIKLSPLEIEDAALKHPAVDQAVSFAIPDEYYGEDVGLAVVLKNNMRISKEGLTEFILCYLSENKKPKHIYFLDAIPVGITGKLQRIGMHALLAPKQSLDETVLPVNNSPSISHLEEELNSIFHEVLHLPSGAITPDDGFLSLGGDSLLAVKAVNKINKTFKSNLKVSDLLSDSKIRDIAVKISQTIGAFLYDGYMVQKDVQNLYQPFALNNVQQAYYLGRNSEFELGNISTHSYIEFSFLFLDVAKLENAINKLIERHVGLRTIIVDGKQQYLSVVPYYTLPLNTVNSEDELLAIRESLSHKIYSLHKYPLFDFILSRSSEKYILHISYDALVMDAKSLYQFLNELTRLYNINGLQLPAVEVNYRDYLLQYNKIRKSSLFSQEKSYWLAKIDDYNFNLNLPLKCHPSVIQQPRFSRIRRIIPLEKWDKLVAKANTEHVGLTSILLVIYGKVLSYWSSQDKVCINLTLFNRLPLHDQINEVIADFTALELFNFINNCDISLADEFRQNHQNLWQDMEHNLFDGVDFQRLIRQEKKLGKGQIIAPAVLTSILDEVRYGNKVIDESFQGVNYSISQTSQIWLDNKAYLTPDGFVAEWDYVDQLFEADTIRQMHEYYCALIEYIANADWQYNDIPSPSLSVRDLELITLANSAAQNTCEDTLISRVINASNIYPYNTAVIDSASSVEYKYEQLLSDSQQLATYIRSVITPIEGHGLLIGVLSEKGYSQVVAVVSVMRAGYAYLPLNVAWPVGRQAEVLNQGLVKVLLLSRAQYMQGNFAQLHGLQIVIIEDILSDTVYDCNSSIDEGVTADQVAYVIFTSGSTGRPKGVIISHRSALNTIEAVNQRFRITDADKVLALSDLSFDLSVYDIFGILMAGGTIIFPSQSQVNEPVHWYNLLDTYKATIWNTVPQLAELLIKELKSHCSTTHSLRLFLLSGDKIPLNLPQKIRQNCLNTNVISLGGATEGSIWSVWYEALKSADSFIPYGVAMPNQKLFILDKMHGCCPVSVIGEIYIGGDGVALGYWKDEEKTNASFIHHSTFGRIYKTGDLGRWDKNGYIEFIGRVDAQVKLNGYRVELGEIEARLCEVPGVAQAVVKLIRGNTFAYILPELNTTSPNNLSKYAHKEQSLGIRNDLPLSYKLAIYPDEGLFKQRKSYRNFLTVSQFNDEAVSIKKASENALYRIKDGFIISKPLPVVSDEKFICDLLTNLSAIKLKNRKFNKYLYPSPGSSYSVRCYLELNQPYGKVYSGHYYFNPLDFSLNKAEQFNYPDRNYSEAIINLVIYWPAILPLYGDRSQRLAFLEVGHMLGLLTGFLQQQNIAFDLQINDYQLDNDNTLAASLILGSNGKKILPVNLKLAYMLKQNNTIYREIGGERIFDVSGESVFFQANRYGGRILEGGSLLLCLEGDACIENYVLSGILCQNIADTLYEKNIGSCMLGFEVYPESVYAVVFGRIVDSDKLNPESELSVTDVGFYIEKHLKSTLPAYMLPYAYLVVKKLALNANGKLDRDKLVSPLEVNEKVDNYSIPRNKQEEQVTTACAKILNLPVVGIDDDFFKLGGNSLQAIELIQEIKKVAVTVSLQDLFLHRSIRKVLDNLNIKSDIEEFDDYFLINTGKNMTLIISSKMIDY